MTYGCSTYLASLAAPSRESSALDRGLEQRLPARHSLAAIETCGCEPAREPLEEDHSGAPKGSELFVATQRDLSTAPINEYYGPFSTGLCDGWEMWALFTSPSEMRP